MQRLAPLLAILWFARPLGAETARGPQALAYTPSSFVNSASNQSGAYAPNTMVTLYGTELAFSSRCLAPKDIVDGVLPTYLTGTGVKVLIAGLPAFVYCIAPGRVDLLIPGNLLPGPTELQLFRDGRAGPAIPIDLAPLAPAMFQLDEKYANSTRADGSPVAPDSPATPGEVLTLTATGLGEVAFPLRPGELAPFPISVSRADELVITLDGQPVPRDNILYAGVAPGFAGLYQVKFLLPSLAAPDPEIRIAIGEAASPPGLLLPAKSDRIGTE